MQPFDLQEHILSLSKALSALYMDKKIRAIATFLRHGFLLQNIPILLHKWAKSWFNLQETVTLKGVSVKMRRSFGAIGPKLLSFLGF